MTQLCRFISIRNTKQIKDLHRLQQIEIKGIGFKNKDNREQIQVAAQIHTRFEKKSRTS